MTAIEILSPVNKRPGIDAADACERKRRDLFHGDAHVLEIDLLRGGRRPALEEPLPDVPYFVFLSRAERRPTIEIWPLSLREPIPVVPIPLRWPDPDVPLDLTDTLARVYRGGRYDLRIDYRQPPPPPSLSAEDAAWLDSHCAPAACPWAERPLATPRRDGDHPRAPGIERVEVVGAVEPDVREAGALQQQLQLEAPDVAQDEGGGNPLDPAVRA